MNRLSPFGLFRKKKPEQEQQEQVQEEKPLVKEQSAPETTTEVAPPETPPASPQTLATPEKTVEEVKTYLRAMPLRELSDLETVMNEVKKGNIIILRITPLASKSLPDVKQAVDQLYAFAASVNGDIARLGEERVVVCPEKVRIWREKTPVQNEPIPTAA
jgi:SepF-like predicted cell division protein (DUF552 family)